MMCNHAYVMPLTDTTLRCLDCGEVLQKKPAVPGGSVVMPVGSLRLDEARWNRLRGQLPGCKGKCWTNIPYSVVKSNGWYLNELKVGAIYLVMPIYRAGKPVFYSARLAATASQDGGGYLKYRYPTGVDKVYWTSVDPFAFRGKTLIFTEGVADAAYAAYVTDYEAVGVALLGSWYNGSLTYAIAPSNRAVILLDGDARGIEAAMRLHKQLRDLMPTMVVVLDDDPTDLSPADLKQAVAM